MRSLPLSLVMLAACGAAAPRAVPEIATIEEARISREAGAYAAAERFARAARVRDERGCRAAVDEEYEPLVREFPTSRYVLPSLYNAALCLDASDTPEAAVPYYERLIDLGFPSRDGRHGALQLVALWIRLERWEPALTLAERLLRRDDLEPVERLELLAYRACGWLGQAQLDDAERAARDALAFRNMLRALHLGRTVDPSFAASANYVMAETFRLRAEATDLSILDEETQRDALERRAQFLFRAQREYYNAVQLRDPRWSDASGERIGPMYEALWQSVMEAPSPPEVRLTPSAYRASLVRDIEPLMREALRYGELTVSSGADAAWVAPTRVELERMRSRFLGGPAPGA